MSSYDERPWLAPYRDGTVADFKPASPGHSDRGILRGRAKRPASLKLAGRFSADHAGVTTAFQRLFTYLPMPGTVTT